ncbi:MAG: PHP domain-containing protein [Anaerolineae bacterium]|nr:PHP domain-containing protein [Anaerolineae bacterium]MDW8070174.1 PHP domain-containing protein [Anaerolineae bacterium]
MELEAQIATWEAQLNDFDPHVRATALAALKAMADQGAISPPPLRDVVNMHCHTFFSFNAYGYSPSGLAWLAWRQGFRVIGIVDFDVLHGVEEFLTACEALGVRGTAGLETRVFIPQFATREINSPGEPGIAYHMGIGFTSSQVPAEAAEVLAHMGHIV